MTAMPPTTDPGAFPPVPWIFSGFGDRDLTETGLRALARERGLRPVILHQIHSDIIHVIEDMPTERLEGDALVTDVPGLLLVIKTADCLPVLLADERRRVIAAVHAGWRGTRARIVRKAVETLVSRFNARPADLRAALGPCIGPSCYEVGEDVRREFPAADFSDGLFAPAGRPGKFMFDLRAANVSELESAGVSSGRISTSSLCTHCDPRCFSWRRDRDPKRRMFSYIGLRPI